MEVRNYYEILGLDKNKRESISLIAIKDGFRKALLKNHPDKFLIYKDNKTNNQEKKQSLTSIDEIKKAYQVLGDEKKKKEYDSKLDKKKFQNDSILIQHNEDLNINGVEFATIDLDDMQEHECSIKEKYDDEFENITYSSGIWWSYECRCGGTYKVHENILEKHIGDKEVLIFCSGCSSFLRVLFACCNDSV